MSVNTQKVKSMDNEKRPVSLLVLREADSLPVFQNEIQKQHFLYLLSIIQKQTKLYAYCILDEEVCLLMETKKLEIQERMVEQLKKAFEQKCCECGYCDKVNLTGEICGSYSWSMSELMEGCIGLHDLPVHQKLAVRASDYWWSSYREYCQHKGCCVVETDLLLSGLSDNQKYAIRLFASLHNKTYENEICDQICQKSGMIKKNKFGGRL